MQQPPCVRRPRLRTVAVAPAVVLLALLAACSEEKRFTAGGFIAAMNDNGAALALGPVETKDGDGDVVRTVTFTEVAPSATGAGPAAMSGDAALLVFGGTGDAEDEFERCDATPALTCFRAANVVLRVGDLQPSDRARLATAIEAIGASG